MGIQAKKSYIYIKDIKSKKQDEPNEFYTISMKILG